MSVATTCQELRKAVESSSGEREIHRQLEAVPWILFNLIQPNTNGGFVVSHFSLGDEYEADFVVLHGYSAGWYVHFVELEPASLSPFNRSGNYSPRLNHSAGQIRRWKLFAEQPNKQPYLLSQLARTAQLKDLLRNDGREPVCSSGWRFDDPRSVHSFHFHVIMGRRQHLDDVLLTRKASLAATDGFELITYDRVLEEADAIENDPSYSD